MVLLSMFAAFLAVPETPVELHANGPWQVEETDNGCKVTRAFASDADVALGFETYLTTSNTTMVVAAPKSMLPGNGNGSIRVATTSGQAIDVHYGSSSSARAGIQIVKLFPNRESLTVIALAEVLEIGATPIRIPAKGLDRALKALNDCTAGKLSAWGVDPKPWRDGKLAGFAGQPQSWLTYADARRILPSGINAGRVLLLVTTTPAGGPASCKAVQSSDPRLDAPMCDLAMKRAKFRAPLGDDGKPMASYVMLPMGLSR